MDLTKLQAIVDGIFAYVESQTGMNPIALMVLEWIRKEIDAQGLPALADYLTKANLTGSMVGIVDGILSYLSQHFPRMAKIFDAIRTVIDRAGGIPALEQHLMARGIHL